MSWSQNQQSLLYRITLSHTEGMQRMCNYVPSRGWLTRRKLPLYQISQYLSFSPFPVAWRGSTQTEEAVAAMLRRSQYTWTERERSTLGVKPEQRQEKVPRERVGLRKDSTRLLWAQFSSLRSPHRSQGEQMKPWLPWEVYGGVAPHLREAVIQSGWWRPRGQGRNHWKGEASTPSPCGNSDSECQIFTFSRRSQKSRFLCETSQF